MTKLLPKLKQLILCFFFTLSCAHERRLPKYITTKVPDKIINLFTFKIKIVQDF